MQFRGLLPPCPLTLLLHTLLVCLVSLPEPTSALSCYCTTNKGDANCNRGYCHEQQAKSDEAEKGRFACAAVKMNDQTHLACVRSKNIGQSQTICKQIGSVTACWCTESNYCNKDLLKRALIEDENGGRADGVGGGTEVVRGTEPGFRIETESYRPEPSGGHLERPSYILPAPARPPTASPPISTTSTSPASYTTPYRSRHLFTSSTSTLPPTSVVTAYVSSRAYPEYTRRVTEAPPSTTAWNPNGRSKYWWLDPTNPPSLLVPTERDRNGESSRDRENERESVPSLFDNRGDVRPTDNYDRRYAGRLTTPTENPYRYRTRTQPTTIAPRTYLHKTIRTWVWTKAMRPYTTPTTTSTTSTTTTPPPTTTTTTTTTTTPTTTTRWTTAPTTSTTTWSWTRPSTTTSTSTTTPTSRWRHLYTSSVSRRPYKTATTTTTTTSTTSTTTSTTTTRTPPTLRTRIWWTTSTRRLRPSPSPSTSSLRSTTTTPAITTSTERTTPRWFATGSWTDNRKYSSTKQQYSPTTLKTVPPTPYWLHTSKTSTRSPIEASTTTTWSWYQKASTRRRPSWWAPDTTKSTTEFSSESAESTPAEPKNNWLSNYPKRRNGAERVSAGSFFGWLPRFPGCILGYFASVLFLQRLRLR